MADRLRLDRVTTLFLAMVLAGAAQAAPQAQSQPQVAFDTSDGRFVVELYPQKAPKTVANFLHYVREGFYDGTIFHRVIPGFVIQGGGYTSNFERKPTQPPIVNEASNGLRNERGTIAMARTADPDSATSQFFINLSANETLNHRGNSIAGAGYAVFGKVIQGMDVVHEIATSRTGPAGPFPRDVPRPIVVIRHAKLLQNGSAADAGEE